MRERNKMSEERGAAGWNSFPQKHKFKKITGNILMHNKI